MSQKEGQQMPAFALFPCSVLLGWIDCNTFISQWKGYLSLKLTSLNSWSCTIFWKASKSLNERYNFWKISSCKYFFLSGDISVEVSHLVKSKIR